MGNSPRQVAIGAVSFTVSFKSAVHTTEFNAICNEIGGVRGVTEIGIAHLSQQVKVTIGEASIGGIIRIRREICDMLMGRNCSPHLS